MAFPTVEDRVAQSFGTSATTFDIDLPATVNADELLLLFIACDRQSELATLSGWTKIFGNTSGVGGGQCFAKKAAGTEGGTSETWSVILGRTGDRLATRMLRISGWGGTISTDIDYAGPVFSGLSSANPPSVTAGWGSDDNLFLAFYGGNSASGAVGSVSAFSTNYSNGADIRSGTSGTSHCHGGLCERDLAADNDDPGTWTATGGGQGYSFTVVVEPGTAGSGSGATPLTVQDTTVEVHSDNVELTVNRELAVADSVVSIVSDNVELTVNRTLSVDDTVVEIISDSVTLTGGTPPEDDGSPGLSYNYEYQHRM